jgi:hypothetical protein
VDDEEVEENGEGDQEDKEEEEGESRRLPGAPEADRWAASAWPALPCPRQATPILSLSLPHTLSLKETKTKKETNDKPSSSLFSLSLSLSLSLGVTHSSFSTSEGPVDKLYYTDPHATIFVPWVLNK